jgi:hypothetical protein
MSWVVPGACSLPVKEQPLRFDELDALFAIAVRGVYRIDARNLRLMLVADGVVDAITRDLVERETRCCSFFGFSLARRDGYLIVDIEVPTGHTAVLDGIARRASVAATGVMA